VSKRILVISQTFSPDPTGVGQYVTDVAKELARRGFEVRVYTSGRGYEDPTVRYPEREIMAAGDGKVVDVRRLPFASFGKKHILARILGTASFQCQALWHELATPRVAGILFSTSPPLVGATACIAKLAKRVPIAYWAMDLNPDQLVAMGKIAEGSLTQRLLETANLFILRHSSLIVALDRFMQGRILERGSFDDKMLVMPLWPREEHIEDIDRASNPFVARHGLSGRCVIMYSGNHSPANPLTTLLKAAIAFKNDDRVSFVFVGGGLGKREVDACIKEHELCNMVSLPYQDPADLRHSLSAADVHVVSMGQRMAGIIHPSKIYGAMAVGRPVLYLGPGPSHITDLLDAYRCGWQVEHGDDEGMRARIEAILTTPKQDLEKMGKNAREAIQESLSQDLLLRRLGDRLERAFRPAAG
jgi:colanic acid biosynthesis glycosyl transferase WcaI